MSVGYFEKDVKYDKSFYFNTPLDLAKIIGALICYFIMHILIFWGHICLGTTHADELMWLNTALFIFANVWILCMVIFGHYSTKKLHQYEFYLTKINDKEQENKENAAREEQKRKQDAKIAQQASRGSNTAM